MCDKVVIKTGDWLYNAGILGLYNILTHNNKSDGTVLKKDELSFFISELENFSEKYFTYMIDTYEKTFSIYKITSFEDFIINHKNQDFKNFYDDSLEKLNNQIDSVKTYIKSNSYTSAYNLIDCPFDVKLKEKELKKISLKKNEEIQDKIQDIKNQINILYELVQFFKKEDTRKYIGAKNTMYSVIRNAWDKVSILNPQVKNPDMYDEFDSYFVKPAWEYNSSSKEKYKYQCISCSSPIKDLNSDLSFMREIGFDVNRKTSHIWDFNNYVAICPICRLVYACVPAGYAYAYNRGIFVNYSIDLVELYKINTKIKTSILNDSNFNISIYRALQEQMNINSNENSIYELSDVQVVRFYRNMDKDSVKYTFNILSKNILKTIQNSKKEFDFIRYGFVSQGSETLYIYNETMKNLLNNENQFLLIQKLLHYRLSMTDKIKYNSKMIESILKINIEFLRRAGYMEKTAKEIDFVSIAKTAGQNLQTRYNNAGSENKEKYNKKLDSIAYRMLNALKTNNKHAFMDVLINAYMYVQEQVPTIFATYIEKDLEFKNMGYAFISGMIGEIYKKDNSKDKGEEYNE